MLRSVLAVLVGYSVFAVSAVLLFQLSGVDPHGPSGLGFRIFGLAYGTAFAGIGGYVAATIAPRTPWRPVGVVAAVVVLAAVVSLVASPGDHATWTQLASIVLFAPAILAGGRLRIGRR